MSIEIPIKPERKFLPRDFKVQNWDQIEPFFLDLMSRSIGNKEDLQKWLRDRSELEAVLSEDLAWRYIRMTCDTTDKTAVDQYQFFIGEIQPKIAPYSDKLNKKAYESPLLTELEGKGYKIMIRSIETEIKIFREENIPLQTEIQTQAQKFGQIAGAMTVEVEGKELTLQQAAVLLQELDRDVRESVYHKISKRRLSDKKPLDELYTSLIGLRSQVARNADFSNFRDYMFSAMGRFDYTPEDCFKFHESIASEVVPILDELATKRKSLLGVDELRPWDKAVDPTGLEPLKPFDTGKELLKRSEATFARLDTFLGERLEIMDEMGHLDLESRKGKAPGGYNYPLAETGVPFIFMNATSTLRDMVTLMHEGGHAVHSFLMKDLELGAFKETPSEVAELASMSMELLSMDHWEVYFDSEDDLNRAKREHLEQIIETLPWVATIDKFQHWVYENPTHEHSERIEAWCRIFDFFSDSITSWEGLSDNKKFLWQKQLHLFEVPFYYIEYGMAQLGAIAVWKNYKENKDSGLKRYLNALEVGYTMTIPEIYETAGIRFDFSKEYISELMGFVNEELKKID